MSVAVLSTLLAVVLAMSRLWHRAKLLFTVGTCYTVEGKGTAPLCTAMFICLFVYILLFFLYPAICSLSSHEVIFHLLALATYMMGRERAHVGWTYLVGCATLVVAALCVAFSFGLACYQLQVQPSATTPKATPPPPQKVSSSYTPLSQYEASGSTSSEGEN